MSGLPTELGIVVCTAILAASLWIPYIVGVNTDAAKVTDFTRPGDPSQLRPWVHRAYRAHLNLLEQFLPFAVLVMLAHQAGALGPVTFWASIAFFWLRVAHAVGMITGLAGFPLRPILFTAGWGCIIAIAGAIFASA